MYQRRTWPPKQKFLAPPLVIRRLFIQKLTYKEDLARRDIHKALSHSCKESKPINAPSNLKKKKKKNEVIVFYWLNSMPFFFFFFFCNLCLISLGNICKWVEVLKPQSKCCEDEVAPTGCMLGHKMDMWQIKKISFSYASCDMLKGRVQQVILINLSIAHFHRPQLIPSVCCM